MIDADRNLLFGILALQVDFVQPGELIAAMQAWSREKHKPLGQILVEQGALVPKFRELLEPMVDAHVARNGGDPARSLAAMSTRPSALPALTLVDDPDVQASLAMVATDPTSRADSLATRLPEPSTATIRGPRFRILRPHARGGIGEVFVAHDRELNREVALKEIQDRHADDPESRTRFLLEAEVTGGLEHPGIVPVYGLGLYPDGRPYYAMRFIRGDSLKGAIEHYHQAEGRGAADRALALQKLLRRFLDVCDAMAYAHSRGVLHRDLKPGNIMLGKYGETLVVDWGLAKARGRPGRVGDPGEGPLSPGSGSGSVETLPGSAIGTPAYMSPEQAAGELERLGPASDVYSLGATLYSLLAGRAPFRGPAGEVLGAVQRGEFPRPRSVAPSVAPALEAICLKAMALDPEARYDSPRALAEDIERWLADEPVAAYRDPWTAPVARFCRRHESLVVASFSLLVFLVLGLVTLLNVRAEREVARRKVADAVAEQRRAQTRRAREIADAEAARLRTLEEHERSLRSAHHEGRVRDGYAAFDRAREARTARRPGWTWAALDSLAEARSAGIGGPARLRDEAVAALGSLDLRPRAVLDPRTPIGWPAHHFAYSPDGRRLAAIGYRPSMRVSYEGKVLDAETGTVVRGLRFLAKVNPKALVADLEAVEDVAYGGDGRWLAVVTSSGRAHLWDEASPAPEGKPTITWDAHASKILRVGFAGGAVFTTGDDRELRRWVLPERPGAIPEASHAFRASRSLENALEVGDGPSLRIVADGAMLLLDPADLSVRERTALDVGRYEFGWALPGPGGLRCGGIKSWEVGLVGIGAEPPLNLEQARVFGVPGGGEMGLLFDPDGSMMLAGYASNQRRGVRLWDLASGASVANLSVRGHHTIGAAFSPDGHRLAIAEERKVSTYEIRAAEVRSAVAQAGGPIRAFSVSPDGSALTCVATSPSLTATSPFEASTWDLAGGKRLDRATFPGRGREGSAPSASVAHHPGGTVIAQTGNDPSVFLCNPAADRQWWPLGLGGERPRVVFSGDGRRIWAITGEPGGDDRVVLADWATGRVAEIFRDAFSNLSSGLSGLNAIASAEDLVLVGAKNGSCYLFRDGEAPGPPEKWPALRNPVTALALSKNGEWAAIGRQSGALEVRRVAGGEPLLLPEAHRDPVGAVAFSADGRTIATGSTDKTIRLWRRLDAGWGDPLTLPSEAGPVLGLAFAPDGRTFYSLTEGEAAVRAWHLDTLRIRLAGIGLPWEGFRPPKDAR